MPHIVRGLEALSIMEGLACAAPFFLNPQNRKGDKDMKLTKTDIKQKRAELEVRREAHRRGGVKAHGGRARATPGVAARGRRGGGAQP